MTKTDEVVVALYLSVDEAEYIIALIELNEEVALCHQYPKSWRGDGANNLISKIKHRIPAKTGWMTAREERDAAMVRRGIKPMDRS